MSQVLCGLAAKPNPNPPRFRTGAMKKFLFLVLLTVLSNAGCVATSLERHTINQSQSAADYRYQATLHALAMVYADPNTLPSYALLSNGITSVSHTGIASSATTLMGRPLIFASEAIGLTGAHSPQISWTVDPVADYTQLEAMRCACRWVLEGQEHLGPDCCHILADPEEDMTDGPHFGVAQRLSRLPGGWLGCGRGCAVPHGACYADHCGDCWVWVMPEGLEGLAGFTLALQDIATLNVTPSDGSWPANKTPPLLATLWVIQNTAPVVRIHITKSANGTLVCCKEGDQTQAPVQISVGQAVVWQNDDDHPHTATSLLNVTSTVNGASTPKPLFDTGPILPHQSKFVLFDQALYSSAGGKVGEAQFLLYHSKATGDVMQAQIVLSGGNPLYSPTLVFREDREIRPECKWMIEQKMAEGLCHQQVGVVDITPAQWMEWTKPYQGQRTAVKPGASMSKAITQPPSRPRIPEWLVNPTGLLPGGNNFLGVARRPPFPPGTSGPSESTPPPEPAPSPEQ
jgi:hypothetical protein